MAVEYRDAVKLYNEAILLPIVEEYDLTPFERKEGLDTLKERFKQLRVVFRDIEKQIQEEKPRRRSGGRVAKPSFEEEPPEEAPPAYAGPPPPKIRPDYEKLSELVSQAKYTSLVPYQYDELPDQLKSLMVRSGSDYKMKYNLTPIEEDTVRYINILHDINTILQGSGKEKTHIDSMLQPFYSVYEVQMGRQEYQDRFTPKALTPALREQLLKLQSTLESRVEQFMV